VEVRPADPEDAAEIAEVHVRSWQSRYQGLIPQDYLDGLDPAERIATWTRSLAETDWSHGGTLVVRDDDARLVGFAHVRESRDTDADARSVGEVWAIYLAPDAWGKGLGRELMVAALGRLAQAAYDQVTLWVLDTNARARRFYEAAGFQPDGAVKVDDSRGFRLREVRYRRPLR
jgi:ribosomal protein S18 acetylase RimI-like enzyme